MTKEQQKTNTKSCCSNTEKDHYSPSESTNQLSKKTKLWQKLALIAVILVVVSQVFSLEIKPKTKFLKQLNLSKTAGATDVDETGKVDISSLEAEVLPAGGVELPIKWNDLGKKMVQDGVIDEQKFLQLFSEGLNEDEEAIFNGNWNKSIVLTKENSRFMLDILWAFGLANKNDILENGEMTDEKYGGDASKFAATGGWSLSKGKPMNHYSNYNYVTLNAQQQELVNRVSQGIYRPCCGNSTHFPDCNHGMALLGLLELMAANNVSEDEMYQVSLQVNAIWFPQTYLDLATYFKEQGIEWKDVDPKLALSNEHSSSQGYQATRQKIKSLPKPAQGGGGCGV